MPGCLAQIILVQVRSGYNLLGQVRSCYVRLCHVRTGEASVGQDI
jgi:hypothetical protein